MQDQRFKFGTIAKDIITGFTGVITARITYMTGCDQYCITSREANKDGKEQFRYYDVGRIVALEEAAIELPGDQREDPKGGPSFEGVPGQHP
jgi:hypothetical protein